MNFFFESEHDTIGLILLWKSDWDQVAVRKKLGALRANDTKAALVLVFSFNNIIFLLAISTA